MYPSAEEQLNPNKSEVIPMLIQDMNHIEVAQAEIVGAGGRPIFTGFSTVNSFQTNIGQNINLGGSTTASAGAGADAFSDYGIKYSKSDAVVLVTDSQSSSKAVAAAAIQYGH
jgi:hypothetical protein